MRDLSVRRARGCMVGHVRGCMARWQGQPVTERPAGHLPGERQSNKAGQPCPVLSAHGGGVALAAERGYVAKGHCAWGNMPLLKRVVGLPGDRIDIDASGVRVNGRRLPLGLPLQHDASGRPLPDLTGHGLVLSEHELWVMSVTEPQSFDSRYFGPIAVVWVEEAVDPLWTWGRWHAAVLTSLAQKSSSI